MDSQSKLKDYMSQLLVMEDKLRETKLQAKFDEYSQISCGEFEREERLRREEDELRHLRELQEAERRRREEVQAQYVQYGQPYGANIPYNYAAELARQKQEIEIQRLAILQEQVRAQEEENRRLQAQLNSMQVQPVYQYQMPPLPNPQQPLMMMSPSVPYPTQVYFIQNNEPQSNAKTNVSSSNKEPEAAFVERDKQSDTAVIVDTEVKEKKETVVETDQNSERNIGDESDAEA